MVFVDESKVRDYLLVAVTLNSGATGPARRSLRQLILPGQSRLHMRKESDSRRRLILSTVRPLPSGVTVLRARKDGRTDLARRADCIRALVRSIQPGVRTEVCFELDETLLRHDRQRLVEVLRSVPDDVRVTHRHETATREPLLAMPDAIGWAWAKGGDWRRRCSAGLVVVEA
ncbi:hypothetical protein [Curtobacterium sp. ISL-83]|uniref:hypothetical protein n=1 Tax=Curtobacterium sp. ISL-83 TaxID=2819145 RepID=UPI001BEB4204|nr:hypothetical protein [Curtobacterium sp. ISL-83]MBT2501530.1 hypothetical protein [Curtobacterium sp. ISL-83]